MDQSDDERLPTEIELYTNEGSVTRLVYDTAVSFKFVANGLELAPTTGFHIPVSAAALRTLVTWVEGSMDGGKQDQVQQRLDPAPIRLLTVGGDWHHLCEVHHAARHATSRLLHMSRLPWRRRSRSVSATSDQRLARRRRRRWACLATKVQTSAARQREHCARCRRQSWLPTRSQPSIICVNEESTRAYWLPPSRC